MAEPPPTKLDRSTCYNWHSYETATPSRSTDSIQRLPTDRMSQMQLTPNPKGVSMVSFEPDMEWFRKNPCLPAKKIKEYQDKGRSESFMLELFKDAKSDIEEKVKKYSCPRFPKGSGSIHTGVLRCVVLGKVGYGKSSFANMMLGLEPGRGGFTVGHSDASCTKTIEMRFSEEHNLHIIDTPGFADTDGVDVESEIAKIFTIFRDGVHAFIVISELSNPRVSKEDMQILNAIQDKYGPEMMAFSFLVFTKAECYFQRSDKVSLMEYLACLKPDSEVTEFVRRIGSKNIIAVDNGLTKYQDDLERRDVINMIRCSTSNKSYTSQLFREHEKKMVEKRENRLRQRREVNDSVREKIVQIFRNANTVDILRINWEGEQRYKMNEIRYEMERYNYGMDIMAEAEVLKETIKNIIMKLRQMKCL